MGWATGSRNSEVVAEAAFGEAAVAADILDRLFMTQSGLRSDSKLGMWPGESHLRPLACSYSGVPT